MLSLIFKLDEASIINLHRLNDLKAFCEEVLSVINLTTYVDITSTKEALNS